MDVKPTPPHRGASKSKMNISLFQSAATVWRQVSI
nr:MAG TPA: hypothetical protein [Caudoviricetes sp.]